MDPSYLGRGLVIGLVIAAPVGAIGLLCIRRTLVEGRLAGFVTGLGAASADATYGAVAALGLTSVSSALTDHQDWVRVAGGAFLCYLGVTTLRAEPTTRRATASGRGLAVAYVSTFGLTLTNPTTILSFVAVFTGMGLVDADGDRSAVMSLVPGVFLGSALWWLFLSGAVGMFRGFVTPPRLRWINRLSGATLVAFGVLAALSSLV